MREKRAKREKERNRTGALYLLLPYFSCLVFLALPSPVLSFLLSCSYLCLLFVVPLLYSRAPFFIHLYLITSLFARSCSFDAILRQLNLPSVESALELLSAAPATSAIGSLIHYWYR